jgi:DNA-binding NtrC family response regulator
MANQKKRVLIVDDDLAVRSSLKKVLETAGYEVIMAQDGREAAEFPSASLDVVLLDLNLSAHSGWDVFEHLTAQHPFLPVIIITAMPDQYKTAKHAGAGAIMEKPIEAPVLLKTMRDLIAEPMDARLGRLCGYSGDTRYVPPPGESLAGSPPAAMRRPRLRSRRQSCQGES